MDDIFKNGANVHNFNALIISVYLSDFGEMTMPIRSYTTAMICMLSDIETYIHRDGIQTNDLLFSGPYSEICSHVCHSRLLQKSKQSKYVCGIAKCLLSSKLYHLY
jgi:hypothetical protein